MIDCSRCTNRARINGLSQETYCNSCIHYGAIWKKDNYNEAALQPQHMPNKLDYPYEIAAKMARSMKAVTQDEASELITKTKRLHELCCEQDAIIRDLRKELDIAEQTIKHVLLIEGSERPEKISADMVCEYGDKKR